MKLLLDTHTFIWWDSDPDKLSKKAINLLEDKSNIVLLSVVSLWEMQIKRQIGKFEFKVPLTEIIEAQKKVNQLQILSVNVNHVLALDNLPDHHKDPFDRLLIATAMVEGAVLISRDQIFTRYPVQLDW